MRRAIWILFSVVTVFWLSAAVRPSFGAPQRAAKPSGTLSGIVIGPDDRPVPHATISYQSGSGSAPHAAHADARGRFMITRLRADNYNVRASSKGVFSEWENNVLVRHGENKSITLRLIYAKEMPRPDPPRNVK